MTTQNRNAPALRFPEFNGDWEEKKLGQIFKITSGTTPLRAVNAYFENGNHFWVKTTDLNNYFITETEEKVTDLALQKTSLKKLPVGTLLIAMYGGFNQIGRTGLLKVEAGINQALSAIQPKNEIIEPYFLLLYLNHNVDDWKNFAASSRKDPNITKKDVEGFNISFPTLPEQQKIAAFLTAVDEKIQQLAKKKDLLEQYKKGVMQKIFNQEIRFKDDNGNDFADWEEKPLSNFLFETRKRNGELKYTKQQVLSVSGEAGIVNQIQHMGRSYAGESVHNYHIVETGDIVYTKSPLKSNPYGIVKVNKGVAGIVSTLYAVYSCKENIIGEFIDYYFEIDDNTNKYLRPLVRKGAKNDMKINNAHVLTGLISIPSIPEQRKIIDFFEAMDRKINSVNQQLEKTKEYKKGLLQQMFV